METKCPRCGIIAVNTGVKIKFRVVWACSNIHPGEYDHCGANFYYYKQRAYYVSDETVDQLREKNDNQS